MTALLGFESLSSSRALAVVPALVLILAGGSGWWYARTSLNGRSSGSDVLELAWDDVLRLRKVREAFMSVAFLLPIELFLVAVVELLRPLPPSANGSHAGALPLSLAVVSRHRHLCLGHARKPGGLSLLAPVVARDAASNTVGWRHELSRRGRPSNQTVSDPAPPTSTRPAPPRRRVRRGTRAAGRGSP